MIEKIRDKFKSFSSKKRIRIAQGFVGLFCLVFIFYVYVDSESEYVESTAEEDKKQIKTVVLTNAELFENDLSDEIDEKLKVSEQRGLKTEKDIQDLKELFELSLANKEVKSSTDLKPTDTQHDQSGLINYPLSQNGGQDSNYNFDDEVTAIPPQWVGNIVHEERERPIVTESLDQKKKEKRSVKLPPSFMKGYLLTGMDAMTIEGSDDVPEPVMIRVQTPAVLPNKVKADLEGCFVIAEGYGSLATHRVDARLRSISCVGHKGNSVIHAKITGYVQDSDGKRGIKGQVIHRAGSLIARTMIAGAFQGVGDALTGSAETRNISTIGQTVTTPNNNLGSAALGGGVSAASKDVRSLFLQLARQSAPVVEVGAAKEVWVVITDLVELHIEDL